MIEGALTTLTLPPKKGVNQSYIGVELSRLIIKGSQMIYRKTSKGKGEKNIQSLRLTFNTKSLFIE